MSRHASARIASLAKNKAHYVLASLQENVDMMAGYMDLNRFKAVYVVDLCHSLCEQAKQKVKQKGWKNVHIVEGDACTFQPPEGIATLVTFSYSLSSMPLFSSAPRMPFCNFMELQETVSLLLQWCHHFILLWTEPSPTWIQIMASLEYVTSLCQADMTCHADS